MNELNVDIKYKTIGQGKVHVSIFIDGEDVNLHFGLCEFDNEMAYIGIDAKCETIESQFGFTFLESVNRQLLEREIKAFITRYNIE